MDKIEEVFQDKTTPAVFTDYLPKILDDGKRSLARLRPQAWTVEPVKGCNLTCGFCTARLYPRGEFNFMAMETWQNILDIIKVIAPMSRIMLGGIGEPTLHPQLPDFFRALRKTCPAVQVMMFTNGTKLLDGSVKHSDFLDAGVNMIYVDMYGHKKRHEQLAKESGYEWYDYTHKKSSEGFSYKNEPDRRMILLCPNPAEWTPLKKRVMFTTFLNNLDWEAAKKFGLTPTVSAPDRRCDRPAKQVMVFSNGDYSFCCCDSMREVAGTLGNVSDGVDGFFNYWFGEYMQMTRRMLDQKNRKGHPMCSRCSQSSSYSDIPVWPANWYDNYYDGEKWARLPDQVASLPVLEPASSEEQKSRISLNIV